MSNFYFISIISSGKKAPKCFLFLKQKGKLILMDKVDKTINKKIKETIANQLAPLELLNIKINKTINDIINKKIF